MANNVTDLGKVGITLKGEWNSSTSYERLDTVTYEGSLYIAVKDNVGSQPSESNTNWMLGAKHGEFTEQQLEDFKAEVVAESKEEMDDYTDDKKTELDTYTGVKKTELDTYEGTKEAELNTYASGLKDDFDSNATSKTNAFNTNATSKTNDFDSNAVTKTTAFDTNASTKTSAFDDNATAKTTAFDENAEEKTGDFNDNVDTKTAEFDAHVVEKETEFDENVDSIQEQITDIQEFIDSELEQGITEKDTRADVSDSAKWYGELAPEGRTEQKQLSGKNLFDKNATLISINYCTVTFENGIYIITSAASGNPAISLSLNLPAGDYTLNSEVALSNATQIRNSSRIIANLQSDYSNKQFTLTEDATEIKFNWLNSSEPIVLDLNTLQIEQGSTATSYEPYVGGTASPSPDFPQEIRNVEGRSCRNLFNKDTTTTGYRIVWATGEPYAEPTAEISDFIEIKGDTDYILTNKCYIIAYDDAKQYLGSLTNTGIAKSNGITTTNFKLSNDVKYVKLLKYGGANNFIGFQMNEGNTLLPYEPYFEGKRLDFNVCNKNLWADMGDIEKEISSTLSAKRINNVYFLNGIFGDSAVSDKAISLTRLETANYSSYLNVLPGNGMLLEPGTYTCTMKNFKGIISGTDWKSFTAIKVGTTTAERIIIASVTLSNSKSMTFTLTEPTEIYLSIMYQKTTKFNNVSFEIQLEKNNIETEFIKSAQQLIPFPLAEGQKLMEGDYLADDGVHHMRKQKVLDGTEDWSAYGSNDDYLGVQYFWGENIISNVGLCNTFINSRPTVYKRNGNGIWIDNNDNNGGIRVSVSKSIVTSINEWKEYLAEQYANGTPVIIEYELEQEMVDPYTPAQAEAYNKLKKLMLNQGVNHIWTETDGVEPNLQLTYYKSNKERLNNIEARLELLEE